MTENFNLEKAIRYLAVAINNLSEKISDKEEREEEARILKELERITNNVVEVDALRDRLSNIASAHSPKVHRQTLQYQRHGEHGELQKEKMHACMIDKLERNILGALMLDNYHAEEVMTILSRQDFASQDNQVIFNLMEDIVKENDTLDSLTLTERAKKKVPLLDDKHLEKYIFDLAYQAPESFVENINQYAYILHCYASIREWEEERECQ